MLYAECDKGQEVIENSCEKIFFMLLSQYEGPWKGHANLIIGLYIIIIPKCDPGPPQNQS